MKFYLQFGSILIFLLWSGIVIRQVRAIRRLAKDFGVSLRYLMVLGPADSDVPAGRVDAYRAAYLAYKQMVRQSFRIWVVALLLFMAGAFLVGITTNASTH